MIGNVFEVELQLGLKPAELCPYHPVEGRFAGPHNDGRAPLPRIAKGPQAVLAADGGEQPDRPHVGQREPELGLGSTIAVGTAETPAQPLRRPPAAARPPDCRPVETGPPPWRAFPGAVRHPSSQTKPPSEGNSGHDTGSRRDCPCAVRQGTGVARISRSRAQHATQARNGAVGENGSHG